jgi:hypothetical protein
MRIQGFLIPRYSERQPNYRFDASYPVAHTPFLDCPPQRYPARLCCAGLVTLQRDSHADPSSFLLHFQLLDDQGQPTAFPDPAPFEVEFADGCSTCQIPVQLHCDFPAPGRYRLRILLESFQPEPVVSDIIDLAGEYLSALVFDGESTPTACAIVDMTGDHTPGQLTQPNEERRKRALRIEDGSRAGERGGAGPPVLSS